MSNRVQFYAYDYNRVRRIFSFKVENINDAIKALDRFNQPDGFYVTNKGKPSQKSVRIYSRKK